MVKKLINPLRQFLTRIACLLVASSVLCQWTSPVAADEITEYEPTPEERLPMTKGLLWLAEHQQENGCWDFSDADVPDHGKQACRVRATSLAVLTFLSFGQTPKFGRFKDNVRAGLGYLCKQMKVSLEGGDLRGKPKSMVTHAMATLALSESYAMTDEKDFKAAANLAIRFIVNQQRKSGGWANGKGDKPSMSATVWQILALKSAWAAALDIPPETTQAAEAFVDRLTIKDETLAVTFGETSRKDSTFRSNIAGMLAKIYLRWDEDNWMETAKQLAKSPVPKRDTEALFWYTLAYRHTHGELWKEKSLILRPYVEETIQAKGGVGSWHFPDAAAAKSFGRIYQTEMMILGHTIYYRHLPVFRSFMSEGTAEFFGEVKVPEDSDEVAAPEPEPASETDGSVTPQPEAPDPNFDFDYEDPFGPSPSAP